MKKRLILAATHRIGTTVVVRDYHEKTLTWRHFPLSGDWVGMEGFKKVATVKRIHETLWELNYNLSTASITSSGGCRKATAEECKKAFEEIYTGGLRAVCKQATDTD